MKLIVFFITFTKSLMTDGSHPLHPYKPYQPKNPLFEHAIQVSRDDFVAEHKLLLALNISLESFKNDDRLLRRFHTWSIQRTARTVLPTKLVQRRLFLGIDFVILPIYKKYIIYPNFGYYIKRDLHLLKSKRQY